MTDSPKDPDDAAVEAIMDAALAASRGDAKAWSRIGGAEALDLPHRLKLYSLRMEQADDQCREIFGARSAYAFATHLVAAAEAGRLTGDVVYGPVLQDGPKPSLIEWAARRPAGTVVLCNDIALCAIKNAMVSAFQVLRELMELDTTLKNDPNCEQVREMARVLRNAYAHPATDGNWRIDREDRQRVYKAIMDDGKELVIDPAAMHGKRMDKAAHQGWEGLRRILDFVYKRARAPVRKNITDRIAAEGFSFLDDEITRSSAENQKPRRSGK